MASSESTATGLNTPEAPGPDTGRATDLASSPVTYVVTLPATALAMPRIGRWAQIHWSLLLVALLLLVVAGQGQHFFYDEWAFVGGKLDALSWPDRYLLPHNEHWTLLPLLAYRAIAATAGLGSYWPYLALLLLLHLGVTHILWRLMLVTGSKPIVATALAAIISVLGSAGEDLVWAFQITFVGSTLLGVSAIYLAVTGTSNWRKTGVLAGLTLAGVATSGVGLPYLIIVPWIYARRRQRPAIFVLCLPLLAYVTWYAGYGHSLTHPPIASATFPVIVAAFMAIGLTTALSNYVGFPVNLYSLLVVGVPLLAWLTLACRDWRNARALGERLHLAMFVGAVMFFGTAGLARAGLGPGSATSSRYTYVAVALLTPGLARLVTRVLDQQPRLISAVVPVALAMAVSNTLQLFTFAADTRHHNDESRRVLSAASDLVRSKSPVFINQLPEPGLAPDLTTRDLGSGHLDPALQGVSPQPSDRLTASLNLQIRVALIRDTAAEPPCLAEHHSLAAHTQRITIKTSRQTAPTFFVDADTWVALTLQDDGSRSAQRLLDLLRGTYVVSSGRNSGDLTIESESPTSTLATC